MDRFGGDEREYVEWVLMREPSERDKPIPLVTARRVTSLKRMPGEDECNPYFETSGHYSVEVELYTLFGIPYGKHSLDCGGSRMVWYLFPSDPQGLFDFAIVYGHVALVFLFLASPLVGPLLVLLLIAGGVSVYRGSDDAFGRIVSVAAIGEGAALAAGGVLLVAYVLWLF